MATDPDNILVPGTAALYLAPVGTAMPANETSALNAAFRDVGLTTPDGTRLRTNPSFTDIRSHQSNYPTRTIKTADEAQVTVVLQEFSGENLIAALGGGTLTTVSTGHFKYTPPATTDFSEVAAVLEWVDGDDIFRMLIPRAQVRSGIDVALNKTSEAQLTLTLNCIGGDSSDAYTILSNVAAFAPSA